MSTSCSLSPKHRHHRGLCFKIGVTQTYFYHKSTITVRHTRVKPDTEICVVEVGNRSIFKLSRNWNFTKQMYAHMLTQGHAQTHMKTQACRDSIT